MGAIIYEGKYTGELEVLKKALPVANYREPYSTAEGVEIIIKHLDGVTVEEQVYRPSGGMSTTLKTKITLFSTDTKAMGEVEKRILEEIRKDK